MTEPYIAASDLKTYTVGDDASSSTNVWDTLADAVSRLFDREAEVPDGFFLAAPGAGSETAKSFRTNGTEFLNIGPYIDGSIIGFTVDGVSRLNDATYYEQDGFIVFDIAEPENVPKSRLTAVVTARFGFAAVPADIVQACVEQALFMFRRKDMAFAELSGVTSGVVSAKFSPSFAAIAARYRGLYGRNSYFG